MYKTATPVNVTENDDGYDSEIIHAAWCECVVEHLHSLFWRIAGIVLDVAVFRPLADHVQFHARLRRSISAVRICKVCATFLTR